MDSLIQAFLGLFALLFIYNILCSSRAKPEAMEPPQPPGSLPLLGHLPLILALLRQKSIFVAMAIMADKYGPIIMLRAGRRRMLVVSSLEGMKECLTTNDQVLANRPTSSIGKYLGYRNTMLGYAPYGHYWRDMRKLINVHLMSNPRLEAFKRVREEEVDTIMKELYKVWKKNGESHVKVEMKKWLKDLVFNLVARTVVGKQFGMNDAEGEEFKSWIARFFEYIEMLIVASDVLPLPEWIDWKGQRKGMKRIADELDSIIGRYVEEHRRIRSSSGLKGDEDIIDVLLSVVDNGEFSDHDPDTFIKATALTLITSGIDISAANMIIVLYFLFNNPHVLKRAQEELDTHVGKDRKVEESDVKNLVYLQAILKESLRLSPLSTFLAPRVAMEDFKIGGFHVPAGTCLFVNTKRVHRDPRLWPDPLAFKPDRFLAEQAGMDVKGRFFELVPFGTGRRSCPGTSFSLRIMHLTLARLLQCFELAPSSDSPVDIGSMIVGKPSSITVEVLLAPRLPAKLYG